MKLGAKVTRQALNYEKVAFVQESWNFLYQECHNYSLRNYPIYI